VTIKKPQTISVAAPMKIAVSYGVSIQSLRMLRPHSREDFRRSKLVMGRLSEVQFSFELRLSRCVPFLQHGGISDDDPANGDLLRRLRGQIRGARSIYGLWRIMIE